MSVPVRGVSKTRPFAFYPPLADSGTNILPRKPSPTGLNRTQYAQPCHYSNKKLSNWIRQPFRPTNRSGPNTQRLQAYVSIMLNWNQCPVVEQVPGKVSGAWVFKGTRVPVRALFENLVGGATVEQFLEWFPGVRRAQAVAVIKAEHLNAEKSTPPAAGKL